MKNKNIISCDAVRWNVFSVKTLTNVCNNHNMLRDQSDMSNDFDVFLLF